MEDSSFPFWVPVSAPKDQLSVDWERQPEREPPCDRELCIRDRTLRKSSCKFLCKADKRRNGKNVSFVPCDDNWAVSCKLKMFQSLSSMKAKIRIPAG